MKTSARYSAIAVILLVFSTSALADIRIELIKGKRSIKDRVSFNIEVLHETNENPRYIEKPEFIEISASFGGPASGSIAIDGTGVQRFDETTTVEGQRTEITYGRHTVTLQVSNPAVATGLVVFVRGGVVHELIGDRSSEGVSSTSSSVNSAVEQRLADLERRVRLLESEVAILRRGRRNQ